MVAAIDRRTDHQITKLTHEPTTDTTSTTNDNTTDTNTTDTNTTQLTTHDPAAAADSRERFNVESGASYRARQIQASFTEQRDPGANEPDPMGVASYNLAGGAATEYRDEYGVTHAHAAKEVVQGGSDVLMLQEVGVGRNDGGATDKGLDYNEQVLVHSLVQTAAPDLGEIDGDARGERIDVTSVDAGGNAADRYDPNLPNMRYTYQNNDGSTSTVDVNRTTVDEHGNELPWDPNGQRTKYTVSRDGQELDYSMTITKESLGADGTASVDPATGKPVFNKGDNVYVYNADIGRTGDGSSQQYTIVYGKSYAKWGDGASAGNSVMLGPNNTLKRDENGAIEPGQIENHLLSGSDTDGRRALGVKMQHEGRDVTVVNLHMTNGNSTNEGHRRSAEYRELKGFVDDFGDGRAVVGGDFNSKPGDNYGRVLQHEYPDTGLDLSHKGTGNGFDYFIVSPDLDVSDTDTSEKFGGSDHDMIEGTVTIPA